MSGQHRHQGEPLWAVGALERALTRVNTEVFDEHEAQREPFAALVALVGSLPSVGGQMPLNVRPPSVRLLTMWTFKLTLHLMHLPVLRACEQGVEAFAALLADVAFSGDVGLPVLQQLRRSRETLTADGAHLRQLALLRVRLFMVDSQRPQVGEGAPAYLAGEGDGYAVMFALVLRQIPRVLEGSVTLRAVKRSLSRVSELVSPDIRRPGERLTARFACERSLTAVQLRNTLSALLSLLCFSLPRASSGKKFNRCKYFICAGGGWCKFNSRQSPVCFFANALHVEVWRTVFIRVMERTLRAGEDDRCHLVCISFVRSFDGYHRWGS